MTALEIGQSLKYRREFLNISQQYLSEMSGVALRTIRNVERGEGNPSFDVLFRIAEILGMDITTQVKKIN